MATKTELEREYERAMGRPARRLPDDHPDAWQWDYRGTKEEREELLDKLSDAPAEVDEFEQVTLDL